VDLALKSQFYMLGLSEENVVSRKSQVRKRGKQKWTLTTTTIQLPRPIPFRRLVRRLSREMASLGEDISVVKKRDQGGVLELQVRVQNVVAHNLLFYEPKVVKPEIPLKGRIAIVIDDLGQDRQVAMDFIVKTPSEIEERLSIGDFFIKKILEKGRVLYEKPAH